MPVQFGSVARPMGLARQVAAVQFVPREIALGRRWASKETHQLSKKMNAQARQSESPTVAQRQRPENSDSRMKDMLLPGTFIAQPISEIALADQPSYQWQRLKSWAQNYFYRKSLAWSSKAGIFKPAVLKYESRSALAAAATQLLRDVNTAMAAGDLPTLRRLCGHSLYASFAATVARRRTNERFSWTLAAVNGSPRVVASRLLQMPNDDKNLRQMVAVRINSSQELTKLDPATGLPIESSKKVQTKSENLMMFRPINSRTYEKGQWYLFGFLPDTTPESWQLENDHLQALQMEAVKRYMDTKGKKHAGR